LLKRKKKKKKKKKKKEKTFAHASAIFSPSPLCVCVDLMHSCCFSSSHLMCGFLLLSRFQVAEDLAMVAYVRDRFNTLHNVAGINIPVTSNGDILAQASSLQPLILEKLDEPSAITISQLKADLKAFDCIRPNKNKLSTLNEVVPASTVQDAIQVSGTDLPGIIGGASKNLIGVPPNYPIGGPTALRQSINGIQMDMLETKLFGLSCLDKSQAYAQLNNYKMGEFEEPSYGVNPFSTGFTTEQPFGDTSANDTCHKSVGSFSSFPVDSELHEVLGHQ